MIESYIFDLYGTLVDIHTDESAPSLWRRMALLLSLQGAAYAPEELKKAYIAGVEAQIERRAMQVPAIPRGHVEPDILSVFESLYAQKGLSLSADRIRNTAVCFRTLSIKRLRLYPDTLPVLNALHEQKRGVYLLSNAQAAFTMPELNALGLAPMFDGIVLSSNVGVKKPNRIIFDHILSKYDLHSEMCMMVGNDEAADMLGASTVGMAGRYIHTKQSPARQQPLPEGCSEIHRLRELL